MESSSCGLCTGIKIVEIEFNWAPDPPSYEEPDHSDLTIPSLQQLFAHFEVLPVRNHIVDQDNIGGGRLRTGLVDVAVRKKFVERLPSSLMVCVSALTLPNQLTKWNRTRARRAPERATDAIVVIWMPG